MSLILIRHAETDAHDSCYSGQVDIPLNRTGEQQAQRLAEQLAPYPVSHILSSTMERAVHTAAPLATARGLTIEQRASLLEISYGELEGQEKGVVSVHLRKQHICTPVPGGESLWQVWNRLAAIEAELRQRAGLGQQLVVIGHYWSNRLLLGRLLRQPFEFAIRNHDYKPANASALLLSTSPDGEQMSESHWIHPDPARGS